MLTLEEKKDFLGLLIAKRAKQLEKSFHEFVLDYFEVLNPHETLIDNWHIKYLCDVLQRYTLDVINGVPKKTDLIINVPPRSLKSFILSICLPCWAWTHKPSLKFIGSSYAEELSTDFNTKARRIVQSELYNQMWPEKFVMAGDQNLKKFFENDETGFRRSTSTGGAITGSGGDIIIIDDPQNPKLAESEVERKNVISFFDHTLSTRLNNPATGLFIVIMQRLHENDLTGHLISNKSKQYEHICIPALKTKDIKPAKLVKHYDEDNLFFPKRFTRKYLDIIKKKLGSYQFAGQMLQTPSPEEGGILKRDLWQKYEELPKNLDIIIISIDAAFKDLETSDYVVMEMWAKKGVKKYLIDLWRGQWDFKKTLAVMVHIYNESVLLKRYINGWYIEAKANGDAIISVMEDKLSGVVAVNPKGSKQARAMATQPQQEAGNIYLPDPKKHGWVDDFIDECANFPFGSHDDQVDSYSQAMEVLQDKTKKSDKFEALSKM